MQSMTTIQLDKYCHLSTSLHSTRLNLGDLILQIKNAFNEDLDGSLRKLSGEIRNVRIDIEMFERVITDRIKDGLKKDI